MTLRDKAATASCRFCLDSRKVPGRADLGRFRTNDPAAAPAAPQESSKKCQISPVSGQRCGAIPPLGRVNSQSRAAVGRATKMAALLTHDGRSVRRPLPANFSSRVGKDCRGRGWLRLSLRRSALTEFSNDPLGPPPRIASFSSAPKGIVLNTGFKSGILRRSPSHSALASMISCSRTNRRSWQRFCRRQAALARVLNNRT